MIILKKKAKIIVFALVFALIAAAGFAVERLERDAFVMETVAVDDGAVYTSQSESIIEGRININSADASELVRLDGIGEALAGRIIAYREEHGAYGTIEEIMKVAGISEKKFELMKNDICVE